ncbi:Short transient receptor potential channel 5 [Blattella germanica]|nr:Short transient receptor potential channel 5 [Blattella germanica]
MDERDQPVLKGYRKLPTEFDESTPEDESPRLMFTNTGGPSGSKSEITSSPSKVARGSSLILPKLLEAEKKFFDLVSAGDVDTVKEFLQENHGLKINSNNYKGVTALQIAVLNHNEEMVMFLLAQRGIEVGDCALHAVNANQPRILVKLLDALAAKQPILEFQGCPDSSKFPDYVTPLMLAAHCGHYEIIGLLLERGHEIIHPHHPKCFCEKCQEEVKHDDGLKTANCHFSIYRAISNPAYICQTSADPILTAFQLHRTLLACTSTIIQLRGAYFQLSEEVKTFAVELMGKDSAEVEDLLSQWDGCDNAGQVKFPRLMMAIDYNQREFVAHPNTQEVLDAEWCGEWHQWRKKSDFRKLITIFPRMIMLPYIALLCMVAPRGTSVQFHNLPVNKLLNDVASYLIFLIILFFESNQDKANQKRGPPNTGTSMYDTIMQTFFWGAIIFWLSAYFDAQRARNENLERKYWHPFDHTLVAEGFFTMATILAFLRVLLLLQLNFQLGCLQVALQRIMTEDILKFFIILLVVILAFTAGLCKLYNYYDGMIYEDKETGTKTQQMSSFVNFWNTLNTLFWAIFCMSPIESADVIIENIPAGYSILVVFVIVNMMIAELCNTMQKVVDNVNVEWVFGRSVVSYTY